MPLKEKNGKFSENIGVVANLYRQKLENGVLILKYIHPLKEPVSMKYFIRHIENNELYDLFGSKN